jgi:hypothetical protein
MCRAWGAGQALGAPERAAGVGAAGLPLEQFLGPAFHLVQPAYASQRHGRAGGVSGRLDVNAESQNPPAAQGQLQIARRGRCHNLHGNELGTLLAGNLPAGRRGRIGSNLDRRDHSALLAAVNLSNCRLSPQPLLPPGELPDVDSLSPAERGRR